MYVDSVKTRDTGYFLEDWAGFDRIYPLNVIIGRNNTGKSHLLDLVSQMCDPNGLTINHPYSLSATITEQALRGSFTVDAPEGALPGNPYDEHGALLLKKRISWTRRKKDDVSDILFPDGYSFESDDATITEKRFRRLETMLRQVFITVLTGKQYRRLRADRDIRPEKELEKLTLSDSGDGATNIIRRFLNSSSADLPRETITKDLLCGLNEVFHSDSQFNEITVQQHDVNGGKYWEIYLGESTKGLIALSKSGSGLKTVLLVLLNFIVLPVMENRPLSSFVFALEELENNLHPALLRRLYGYLANKTETEETTVFLSTHSSTALDFFGPDTASQIIQVCKNDKSSSTRTIDTHFDHLNVVSDLGARPSDILQSNGIIWVEGPSDVVYINRWIEIFSNGEMEPGRDFQCAFYGGALLARLQVVDPKDADEELVNLITLNPNVIVVCDGDRPSKHAHLKGRVKRIRKELQKVPSSVFWATQGREIENYIPGSILQHAFSRTGLPDPLQYEPFFPRKGQPRHSYIEINTKQRSVDKMDLAAICTPHMTMDNMKVRFDLEQQMRKLIRAIREWNQ